ncbi:MAG TPA: extracellular solute-binding protein, partial [Chroococcales cyanobacterium]
GGSPIPLFFAWQNRADLLDPSQTRADVQNPAFKEAVDYYVDFFREGSSPREVGGLTNFYQAFASGYFAMFISGPWEVKGLRDKVPALAGKWGVAPLPPKKEGGSRASVAGGSSLVILKDARHREQAWALIEYLSRPEVQAAFYQATTDLPARISAWKDPQLARDTEILAFYRQLQDARPTPKLPEWEQLADKLGVWVEKAVYGKVDTCKAMAGLSRDLDQVLEKRRWLKARKR